MINNKISTSIFALSALCVAGLTSPSLAGDYRIPARDSVSASPVYSGGFNRYGSLKDVPVSIPASAGNCYMRVDTGYAFANDPDTYYFTSIGPAPVAGSLVGADRDGSWFAEAGIGCAASVMMGRFAGSGLRLDATFGFRGQSGISGRIPGKGTNDLATTNVETFTNMYNVYKDFGGLGSITPYVGAGIGFAYHVMDHVNASHDGISYTIEGDSDLDFAWSLMAGINMQVTNRLSVDLGYRYIDMGEAASGTNLVAISSGTPADPYFTTDMKAHEIKVGLRYAMGR